MSICQNTNFEGNLGGSTIRGVQVLGKLTLNYVVINVKIIHECEGDFPVLNEFQKREVFEGERVSQFHKGLKAQVWIIHQMEIFLHSVLSGKPNKTRQLHHPPQLASEIHHLKDTHTICEPKDHSYYSKLVFDLC